MRPLAGVLAVSLVGLQACLERPTAPSTDQLTLSVVGPGSSAALDSGYVRVVGPTSKTVKVTPGTTVTVDGLAPGSYTVALEGFRGGGVAFFGQTSGVSVVAGQNTGATITFDPFQPTIIEIPSYTVDGQFEMVYSRVPAATGYIVQRDVAPTFASPQETSIAASDTSPDITIPTTGPFFMRVLAVSPYNTRGQPSLTRSITTVTTVTVTPATATIAIGATQAFSAVAKDAQNNTVTGITFFWHSNDPSVALVDPTSGVATGRSGGATTISALGLGIPGSATLNVTGQMATQLAFTVQPTNTTAGAAISPALEVEVRDASGSRVTEARNAVTIAIGTNPSGGVLSGTRTVNAVNGIATFPGLSVDYAGTGYTLVASSGTLMAATSAAFNITPGPTPTGVALLANATYVDFNTGSSGSEASNVLLGLQSFGLNVTPFLDVSTVGIVDATANTSILVIPELERGDLTPALSPEARQRIVSFVQNGGTLMVFFFGIREAALVNTLFGYTIARTAVAGPYPLDGTAAAGTSFAGGPASVPNLSATLTLDGTTLPAGSKVIYANGATGAVVAVVPRGSGQIIILGWDWFDAPPLGLAAEGGWLDVMRRATVY